MHCGVSIGHRSSWENHYCRHQQGCVLNVHKQGQCSILSTCLLGLCPNPLGIYLPIIENHTPVLVNNIMCICEVLSWRRWNCPVEMATDKAAIHSKLDSRGVNLWTGQLAPDVNSHSLKFLK